MYIRKQGCPRFLVGVFSLSLSFISRFLLSGASQYTFVQSNLLQGVPLLRESAPSRENCSSNGVLNHFAQCSSSPLFLVVALYHKRTIHTLISYIFQLWLSNFLALPSPKPSRDERCLQSNASSIKYINERHSSPLPSRCRRHIRVSHRDFSVCQCGLSCCAV
jgi:hypothetical protein